MLLNDFYDILDINSEESVCIYKLKLNASHPIYKGHFEGHPIVPGVCTLQILKECANSMASKSFVYARISSCKFLLPINPIDNCLIKLRLKLTEVDNSMTTLQAEGSVDDLVFIKLKATLKV